MGDTSVHEDFLNYSKTKDIGRWYVTNFVRQVAASLPPGTAILDAGAGECAYKQLFAHCRYVSVDLAVGEQKWNYSNLNYIAPLDDLPFQEATFNAVLCTQVLEHLEWPLETLSELYRILKPGGKLFLTAPMAHSEHQVPHDYYRFTSFGLRSICEHAGFKEVNIESMGGIFTRWAYEISVITTMFPGTGLKKGRWQLRGILLFPLKMACQPMVRLAQYILLALDRYDKITRFPLGWSLTARK